MSYCVTEKLSEYSSLCNVIVHLWTEKQRIIFGSCDLHCMHVLFTCPRVSCVSVHFTTESLFWSNCVCKLGATIRLGNNLSIDKVTVQSYVSYDASCLFGCYIMFWFVFLLQLVLTVVWGNYSTGRAFPCTLLPSISSPPCYLMMPNWRTKLHWGLCGELVSDLISSCLSNREELFQVRTPTARLIAI